jgi:hypothetical protein
MSNVARCRGRILGVSVSKAAAAEAKPDRESVGVRRVADEELVILLDGLRESEANAIVVRIDRPLDIERLRAFAGVVEA